MKAGGFLLGMTLLSTIATAQRLQCSFDGYKPIEGLHAGMNRGTLEMAWQGEAGQQLQALFSIHDGHPVVQQLAARSGGAWDVLGKDLTPDSAPHLVNPAQPAQEVRYRHASRGRRKKVEYLLGCAVGGSRRSRYNRPAT